jgi:hypothetical protein
MTSYFMRLPDERLLELVNAFDLLWRDPLFKETGGKEMGRFNSALKDAMFLKCIEVLHEDRGEATCI